MATNNDKYISINGTDLTSFGRSVEFTAGVETVDDTAFGDSTRSAAGSLKTGSFTAEFNQSFASGGPHLTLNGIVGTVVTVVHGPNGATAGATNPHQTQSFVITEYNAFSGTVGDQQICTVAGVAAGDLSYVTA